MKACPEHSTLECDNHLVSGPGPQLRISHISQVRGSGIDKRERYLNPSFHPLVPDQHVVINKEPTNEPFCSCGDRQNADNVSARIGLSRIIYDLQGSSRYAGKPISWNCRTCSCDGESRCFDSDTMEKTTSCCWNGALESNDWLQLRRKNDTTKLTKTAGFRDISAIGLFGCGRNWFDDSECSLAMQALSASCALQTRRYPSLHQD